MERGRASLWLSGGHVCCRCLRRRHSALAEHDEMEGFATVEWRQSMGLGRMRAAERRSQRRLQVKQR